MEASGESFDLKVCYEVFAGFLWAYLPYLPASDLRSTDSLVPSVPALTSTGKPTNVTIRIILLVCSHLKKAVSSTKYTLLYKEYVVVGKGGLTPH